MSLTHPVELLSKPRLPPTDSASPPRVSLSSTEWRDKLLQTRLHLLIRVKPLVPPTWSNRLSWRLLWISSALQSSKLTQISARTCGLIDLRDLSSISWSCLKFGRTKTNSSTPRCKRRLLRRSLSRLLSCSTRWTIREHRSRRTM